MSEQITFPEHLIPLSSNRLDSFGVTRETLKNWIKNYTTQDGRRLGGRIGGRWYVNLHVLFDFIEEQVGGTH